MTEEKEPEEVVTITSSDPSRNNRRGGRRTRTCVVAIGVFLLFLLLVSLLFLVLALTVFKPKTPRIDVLSSTLDGISPLVVMFPVMRVELNISLNLRILISNPNKAAFRHGMGNTVLFYRGMRVGEAELSPGEIRAMRSSELQGRLTLQMDRMAADMGDLVRDVLAGEMVVESRAEVPGRVTFLRVFKKHIVAVSGCRFTVGVMDMKIRRQECMQKAKL